MTDRFDSDVVTVTARRQTRRPGAGLSKAQLAAIVGTAGGAWIALFGLAWTFLA